jgi:hypothetical protein
MIALIFLFAICFGVAGAAINSSKGRDGFTGFLWGFLLGLIGLIVVCARPSIKTTPAS